MERTELLIAYLVEKTVTIKNLLIEKLGKYEDLEERLNKVYGDCDGLLLNVVETLEKHSSIDITNNTLKSRLLTDEDVDKWEEYKQLEEQGRLIKLPCKVGTKVYAINRIIDYGEVGDEVTYSYSIIEREFQIYMMMDYGKLVFGKTVFLTKSEAEAKLKELRGDNDGSVEQKYSTQV